MSEGERIVRYTAEELREMRAAGLSQTDWARVDAMTEEELEASIDFEEEGVPDWSTLQAGIPGPRERLNVLLDVEVVEWFKVLGVGYQTRMNEVLRSYMETQKRNATIHISDENR
jgi:uncharacterized protein (DUF4415 family)